MKTKPFMNYLKRMIESSTEEEETKIFYEADRDFQRELLNWDQLETLRNLLNKLSEARR